MGRYNFAGGMYFDGVNTALGICVIYSDTKAINILFKKNIKTWMDLFLSMSTISQYII